ncbi:hypothetical protein QQ045_020638 [Rhodiola kirilowii]
MNELCLLTRHPYTFSNHREGELEVQARLDRAIADDNWMRNFPRASVAHVHLHASDHQLLVLETDGKCQKSRRKFFRFEVMWLDHHQYDAQMRDFWSNCDEGGVRWSKKLKSCKEMLKSWNRVAFGDVRRRIEKLKQELEMVKSEARTGDMIERERKIAEDLDLWLAREEALWMQRSRVTWMTQGDKNTKFFHARGCQRRKKNWIAKLQDSQGGIHEDQRQILEIVTSYFSNIFRSSSGGSGAGLDAQLASISPVISKDMNSALLKDISEEEVKMAVFSLGSLKAPGVDGFPAIFYQKHWDLIKSSVIKEVKDFWACGMLDKEINRTLIVLIPKKKDAIRVEDWRPISLCTVAIKIITKIIVSRLQPILKEIISPVQSAFIKGRIISDNFIVAHKLSSFMKLCRDDRNFFASVKVDMSKAYDRVEWCFLENLLHKMGFADLWVNRVMSCVKSVSYQIKVNDSISKVFRPSRGLRQGDPLSPYMFLLCTEFLNAKIVEGVSRNLISGISICRRAPVISHLFFADDSIFFLMDDPDEAQNLKRLLHQYESALGQRINFEKSEVCFSKNTPADIRVTVCEALGVPQVGAHSRYLGLPLIVGQKKSDICREIVEKIWRKVRD